MELKINREIFKHPVHNCWFPRYDHNPDACLKKVKDHITEMDFAISLCRERNICVQAGGHAGHWANRLSGYFRDVYCFEPDPILFECMELNCGEKVHINNSALGEYVGITHYSFRASSGSGYTSEKKENSIEVLQTTIDELGLPQCEAIFLDTEGAEFPIIRGALNTIKRFMPVLQLEKNKQSDEVYEFLQTLGYNNREKVGRDFCVWRAI